MKYKLDTKPELSNIITKNGKKVDHMGKCGTTYTLSFGRLGYNTGIENTEEGEKERMAFEKALSLAPGTLNAYSDYWKNFYIHIPVSGLNLDDENPLDALYLKILKADKEVAQSTEEYKDAPNKFLFILRSIDIESKLNNDKRELKIKAYALYSAMSLDEKRNALLMFNRPYSMIESMSALAIESDLGDEMDNNYKKFINIASDKKLKVKAEIIFYINKNIIQKGSSKFTYDQELYFNGELIGSTLEEAAVFLTSSKNSKVIEAIRNRSKSEE
ncbi:MAG: hypothetical protein WC346_10655 [Methanogenium sp.]|jgi:hypothetical protein